MPKCSLERAPASNFCLNHMSLWENLWQYFWPNLILFEPVSEVIFRTHLTSIFIAWTLKSAFISMVTLRARSLVNVTNGIHIFLFLPPVPFPEARLGWGLLVGDVLKSSQGTDLCFSCKSVQRISNHLTSLLLQLSRL